MIKNVVAKNGSSTAVDQGGTDRPVGGEENADIFVISEPKVPACNPKRGSHPNSNSTEGMNISPA